LIIVVLSINSLLASTLNNQRLISLNDSLSESVRDNALVICTGSKVILISSYHYFEFGEIKELTLDDAKTNTSIDCPTSSGIQLSLFDWVDANPVVSLTQWFAVKVDVALQIFAHRFYYLFFTSRAPPTLN
jgi:hypothetical protein